MLEKRVKKAFTLAEVLITLGIIGIVAAMTIPIIMQSAQDLELKNQFKKAYSELSNALVAVRAELGYVPDCYVNAAAVSTTTECSTFATSYKGQLKIVKACANNGYAIVTGKQIGRAHV